MITAGHLSGARHTQLLGINARKGSLGHPHPLGVWLVHNLGLGRTSINFPVPVLRRFRGAGRFPQKTTRCRCEPVRSRPSTETQHPIR
ncbi:hypothetical protein LEMLEM_LOCUS3857 [Lemmus lemmus]